ncbi:MAG: MBL fold metallo-hydrolase [Acidobacteriia bacterium]|nr:MBL fold metallo-hydrolase [Terriglobia bacterium]MBV8904038.1 MBL fold metallo-hydrolase [Terriglobia bacterium]
MFRKTFLGIALFAAVGLGAAPLLAQGGRGPERPDPIEKARMLKPNLYLITGGGANTLVRVTPEGLIVVDTKNPGGDRGTRLMEEIKAVSTLPVKYVFNTHHHPDHVGNNQMFLDAGATIIDAEALKMYMASDPRTKDIPGLANQTFAKDYVLKFGGAEVDAHAFGRGHTGDDTMIYFPDAKVVMVSDQITDGNPLADYANGGSLLEWNRSLDGVLKLDFEIAVPGRGEPKSRAEIEAFRNKMATLISRAQDAVKAGATKENFATAVKTDDLGWKLNPNLMGNLYDEITRKS